MSGNVLAHCRGGVVPVGTLFISSVGCVSPDVGRVAAVCGLAAAFAAVGG